MEVNVIKSRNGIRPIRKSTSLCARLRFGLASSIVAFVLTSIWPAFSAPQQLVADPALASTKSVENLANASLSASRLYADDPVVLEKADVKGFTREFIAVQWRPLDRIYLYVVRPAKATKPPVAIYLYGHPSDTDRYMNDGWCERVTRGGYAAVGFVPALTGHRYHDRPMKEWFVSELQESLSKSAHDVQMVLNYLTERGDLDMSNVGLFGVGAGGTIAVMAASVDSRIKAIDLLDPWGDWSDWMQKSAVIPDEERANFVKADFIRKVADFDPVKLLPTLRTPHIRLNQLSDETATPEEARIKIEAALPANAEKYRFDNSTAFFAQAASGGRVFDWIKQQIKAHEPKLSETLKPADNPATPEQNKN